MGSSGDEVYDIGSFLQSKMHAHGVTCSDCHDPHSGKLRAPGNAVCAQCHAPAKIRRDGAHAAQGRLGRRRVRGLPHADAQLHGHRWRATIIQCAFRGPDLSDKLENTERLPPACHKDRKASWAAASIEARRSGRHARASRRSVPLFHDAAIGASAAATELPALVQDQQVSRHRPRQRSRRTCGRI